MGKLYKAKVNEIRELRKQGYLQKETAEKVGVSEKTVGKYAPSSERRIAQSGRFKNIPDPVYRIIDSLLDHIDIIEKVIQLELDGVSCPRCLEGKLVFDKYKFFYVCSECGHILYTPNNICRNCYTINDLQNNPNIESGICRECGHDMYSFENEP